VLIVFGFALLVLTAAIVVLFAMFGELSARLPEPGSAPIRDTNVRPLEDTRIGHAPDIWPTALPDSADAVLLILSTACGSCKDVAAQLSSDPGHTDWDKVGVVVSTAGRQTGETFVATNGLGRFRYYVDEGGDWSRGELGVQESPTALVFRAGRLTSGHVFNDVAALRNTIDNENSEAAHVQQQHKEVV
jgi:hypothetical protein